MDLVSLARLARSRFPGAYTDIDDETLGTAYAKKYSIPVDKPSESGIVSGLKNLAGGFKETVLPAEYASDVVTGPAYALRHPIDSAKLLFGAAQGASQDQFEKMFAAPTLAEGVGHAAAGAIPFVGPAAATAGERIGNMPLNTDEGMRGIGNAAGILLGGKVMERASAPLQAALAKRVGAPAPPVSTNSLDPVNLPEIPMTPSEAAGGGGMAKFEKALESSIPGAGPFEAFRRSQQDALIDDLGGTVTGRMSQPGASLNPYEIGKVLKEALTTASDDMRMGLHRGYAKLSKAMKDKPVDISPVQAVANNRLADIVGNDLIPAKPSELSALEPLTDPKNVQSSFDSVRALRTATRKGELPFHEDVQPKMVDAATEALRNAAQREGQLSRMERLDKGWADWENIHNDPKSLLAKMRDEVPPEHVHKKIVGASLDEIANIKKSIGPESFRDVKARILQDVLDGATSGELDAPKSQTLARATGGVFKEAPIQYPGRRLSGKDMRRTLEDPKKFGEARLKAIFDNPKEYEAVMHFMKTAEHVGASPSSLVGAFINAGLLGKSISAVGQAALGDIPGAASSAAQAAALYGGVNVASRMMTGKMSPSRLMSRVLSRSGGARAMSNYIEALSKKNASLPESIRFKVPDKSGKGKAYFWGRIVGKMMQDEADKLTAEEDQ